MKLSTFVYLIATCTLLTACQAEEETCRESTEVNLRIGLYKAGATAVSAVDSVTVRDIDTDSTFYANRKTISRIELPLDRQTNIARLAVRLNEDWDTLTVIYNSEAFFISYACGMVFTHQIDTVLTTRHAVDSLKIPVKLINTANEQHIQLYR
ncbi:MAG: DUF6452 family protein [Bacteroidales bacterium]|jgi:hypothetical protein|nr:DUF6452 family protein [Bacteroidales bacterium]